MKTKAEEDVLAEREKQRRQWGDAHDDCHDDGVLGDAAATLAAQADSVGEYMMSNGSASWPADLRHRHRGDRRRQLVIAAAFAIAEIDRIDREAERRS